MIERRARYSKIETMVDAMLNRFGQSQPPVKIEAIAGALSIEIRKGDLGDVSGLLVRDQNKTVIGINSKQVRERQRFTIAHELGHYLLHEGLKHHVDHDYRVNFRSDVSSQATNIDEIEANFFAASLLMPKRFLDQLSAQEAIADDDKVADLAKQFDVSRHAMSLRLANVYRTFSPF